MEIWVLIAAAGSGYLAHCWRNLHEPKEAASDTSNDDNHHSGSCSCSYSVRERGTHLYRGLEVSSNQNRLVSESGYNDEKCKDGHLHSSMGVVEETNRSLDMENGAVPYATGSIAPAHFQTQLNAAISYPTDAESSANSPTRWTYNTLSAQQRGNFELFCQNNEGRECVAESLSDSSDCCMITWDPAHFSGDFHASGSGSMLRDEYPIKLIDNVGNNYVVNEKADVWFDDQLWASAYWNANRDTSVSKTNTPVTLQEHEGKRKVWRFGKGGRRRHFSGESRSLERGLPISSSDSCLSVYFEDGQKPEQINDGMSATSCSEEPSNGIGNYLGNELLEDTVFDNVLSNKKPVFLASKRTEGSRVWSERMSCESLVCQGSSHQPCLPLRRKKRWVNACRDFVATPGGDNLVLTENDAGLEIAGEKAIAFQELGGIFMLTSEGVGSANSLWKALLFNFGVGVGMMLTILSDKHCSKKVMRQLEETLHVLQSLRDEVQGRTKGIVKCCQPKDTREATWAEEQISALFEVVTKILDVVEHLKCLVSMDMACNSPLDDCLSNARAKLEAELETELETMQRNLNMEDASEFSCRNPSYQDDLNIGTLINGELSVTGIPNDTEVSSGSNDSGDSYYEAVQNGVPALELAMRLRDLLIAKQEGEITELQAKVEGLHRRLQAARMELRLWKQRALDVEPIEMVPPSHSRVESCCRTEDLFSFHPMLPPLIRRCLNDNADKDFEETSQFSCEIGTGSSSVSPDGLFVGVHGGGDQNKKVILSHVEFESTGYYKNDATIVSSERSVECSDRQSVLHDHRQDHFEHVWAEESRSRKGSSVHGKGKVEPVSEASCNLSQDEPADCIRNLRERWRQVRHPPDWSASEERSSCASDLDEQLGQLLIKRIVEKGKRASSIVEVAQSVMASFDSDDTSSTTGSSSIL